MLVKEYLSIRIAVLYLECIHMTTAQIIAAAREMLPYTSEFDHDVIRVPVSIKHRFEIETSFLQPDDSIAFHKRFCEVEFRKQYIRDVAIGWEFVKIY